MSGKHNNMNWDKRVTPSLINHLYDNEYFVFGSNESGIVNRGTQSMAVHRFGAKSNRGIGICGKSYAIPVKNKYLVPLFDEDVKKYVDRFIALTRTEWGKTKIWYVTDIASVFLESGASRYGNLFKRCKHQNNILLPLEYWKVIEGGYY